MFRHIALIAVCGLASLPTTAQILVDRPTGSSLNTPDGYSQPSITARPTATAGPSVSISRLKVSRKAQQLYEQALKAWGRQAADEAKHKLDRALEIDSSFPDALTLYGGIHANLQEWALAEQSLQKAIHSDPGFSPAYVILAGVYNTQDRFDDAEKAAQQAIAAGANTWDLQYEIARSLIGKGEYENALAITEAALRSKHGPLLHLARAHALLGLQKYSEASFELKTYLHDDPSGDGFQDAQNLLEQIPTAVTR